MTGDLPISAYFNVDQKTAEMIVANCAAQVDEYFQTKILQLSGTCFDALEKKYKNTAFVVDDGNFVLFNYKTALLIKNSNSGDKIKIIGGSNTKIGNITSLNVDSSLKHIVVVNDHKNVLLFEQKFNGDIGPFRQFKIDKEIKTESIEIDEDKKEIRILDSNQHIVDTFKFEP
jgi:hypothetical protein